MQILDIAKQELLAIRIMRRFDGLGEIDHNRPVVTHQDVEVGEVAMDDPRA